MKICFLILARNNTKSPYSGKKELEQGLMPRWINGMEGNS